MPADLFINKWPGNPQTRSCQHQVQGTDRSRCQFPHFPNWSWSGLSVSLSSTPRTRRWRPPSLATKNKIRLILMPKLRLPIQIYRRLTQIWVIWKRSLARKKLNWKVGLATLSPTNSCKPFTDLERTLKGGLDHHPSLDAALKEATTELNHRTAYVPFELYGYYFQPYTSSLV